MSLLKLKETSPLIRLEINPIATKSAIDNRTHEFLDRIFPKKERVMKTYNDGRNHWIQIQIVQYGKPGSGKTEFAKWIAEMAVQKYGLDNVEAYLTPGDLATLLDVGYSKHVVLLYDDDATFEKLNKESAKIFTRIRHVAMERTGFNNGLIMTIVGLHRYHASNTIVRTNMDALIARNPPGNKFDYDYLAQYFGYMGLKALEDLEEKKRKDEKYKSYAVFANPFSSLHGFVVSGLSDHDYFTVLDPKTNAEKPRLERADLDLPTIPDEIPLIGACTKHFSPICNKYPQFTNLGDVFTFWLNMLLNLQSYGDTGQRTVMWRNVNKYSEQIGEAVELAWGDLNPDYIHQGAKGCVDYIKNDYSEWVELKYRGVDYSWSPRVDNLSNEAQELLSAGTPGKCIVYAYIPRKSQHMENKFIEHVYQFHPQQPQRNDPSSPTHLSPQKPPSDGGAK